MSSFDSPAGLDLDQTLDPTFPTVIQHGPLSIEAFLEARVAIHEIVIQGSVFRVETRIRLSRTPWSVRSVVVENGTEVPDGPFEPLEDELDASLLELETVEESRRDLAARALEAHAIRCRQLEEALRPSQAPPPSPPRGRTLVATTALALLTILGGTGFALWSKRASAPPSPSPLQGPELPTPPTLASPQLVPPPARTTDAQQSPQQPSRSDRTDSGPPPSPTKLRVELPPKASATDLMTQIRPSHYRLAAMREGSAVYIDSGVRFENVPFVRQGLLCLQTAHEDRAQQIRPSFTLRRKARLWVLHDRRLQRKPSWLGQFSRTSRVAQVSDGRRKSLLEIYLRDQPPGRVELGANADDDRGEKGLMYVACLEPGP